MKENSPLREVNSDDTGHPAAAPPTSASTAAPGEVSEDDLRAVLSDGHRRSIVAFLDAEDEPVPRREVVEHLAPNEEERERVAIRLHHVHLPKLADFGLLVHDRDAGTVEHGENAQRALGVLTAAAGDAVSNS